MTTKPKKRGKITDKESLDWLLDSRLTIERGGHGLLMFKPTRYAIDAAIRSSRVRKR